MYIPNSEVARVVLERILLARLTPSAIAYYQAGSANTAELDYPAFNKLIALASRHARRQPLQLSDAEIIHIKAALPEWNLAEWNLLETLRVALILSQKNLAEKSFEDVFTKAFPFADEGELCALYKTIPFLPEPQRFSWHMKEACRSNMRSVFSAAACDNPYPVNHFDDIAWRQLVMKAVFIEVPLARIYKLEERLSPTLATMAEDYIAERTSAGRSIPADVELLIGKQSFTAKNYSSG